MPLVAAPPASSLAPGLAAIMILFTCGLLICAASRSSAFYTFTFSRGARPLHYQFAGFAINVLSVVIPGRFDSDVEATSTMSFPWPTLLSPAGYAFAIWGVIYVGEFLGIAILAGSRDFAEVAAPSSFSWFCACASQALWCASFRPWALSRLWLSTFALGATATCLFVSQRALVAHVAASTPQMRNHPLRWALFIGPRSLHLGWTTVATAVNLNAWVGKAAFGTPNAVAVAVASFGASIALAARFAAWDGLCAAAFALAWGLFAVGIGRPVGIDAEALGAPALAGLLLCAKLAAAICAVFAIVPWRAVEATMAKQMA